MPGTNGQIQRILLRIASPSIFARFSALRLFPVFKPEEMVQRKEIHHQKAAYRRNRLILKDWTNHIIRMEKRIKCIKLKGDYVEKSRKKNVFYYVFLKTY